MLSHRGEKAANGYNPALLGFYRCRVYVLQSLFLRTLQQNSTSLLNLTPRSPSRLFVVIHQNPCLVTRY